MRKIKPSKLKKELDKVFSLWVRKGATHCFTCGKRSDVLQCGHFVPRNILVTRWEPQNCRPQCVGCNIWGNGRILDFEANLVKEIGREAVEKLKESRHKIVKLSPQWYQERIDYYKSLLH